jgi:hypothetical protein
MKAELPVRDDGSLPDATFTTMANVGQFVAAACELPQGWPEDTYLAGETLNMSDVIEIIEKVRGRKVAVTKHTKQSLKEQIDAIPYDNEEGIMARFFLQLLKSFADGEEASTVMKPELNSKFPDIKTTGVEDYVRKYWSGE